MAFVGHSDWMFEHLPAHPLDAHVEPHWDTVPDATHATPTDSVASVLKTLWHHEDLMGGANGATALTSAKDILPMLTVGDNAITVDAGGSVALPIKVGGHATSVTIAGLTSYESVTDNLDHKTFAGDSIALTAAEVNSGLSLASTYTGAGHPVNTLSVTASETIGHVTLTSAAQTIKVTDPPATTSNSASNALSLQVSGDNMHGTDPQIEVLVDGQQIGGTYTITADHSSGQTQTIQVAGNFDPTVAHQVEVKFINDNWDGQSGDGHDINAYVSSISLNGQTLNGSQGTNAANNGVLQGNAGEAVMDIDGTLTFSVPAAPPAPSGSSSGSTSGSASGASGSASGTSGSANTLSLQVSGDNMHGTDPQIEVFVDGNQIGGTHTITADHSSGQTQTIQVSGNFDPTVVHQVQVKFINDNWDGQSGDGHDINAYVESISLNGQTINGSQGTNAATNGAIQGNANEAAMDINGTLTFSVPAAPPATSSSSGGSTSGSASGASGSGTSGSASTNALSLQVSGDNMHGTDPQIEVFVDGNQIGGTHTITADHSSGQTQTIQVSGNFDPTVAHQVQVKFINDNWDGQSGDGHDVNAYVESISLNGQTINGSQGTNAANNGAIQGNANEAAMDINGTLTFNVAAGAPAATSSAGSTSGSGSSSSGGNALTLMVNGDNLNGTDPQIQVLVDGQQVGGTFTVTADHGKGETQMLQVGGNFDPTVGHQVVVKFINDNWDGQMGDGHDINVYIESISLNGATIAGIHGTNTANNGAIAPANSQEAVMDANGTLTFSVAAETAASGSGSSTSGGSGASGGTTAPSAGSGNGRDWAFFANEGGEPANWASVNSGWVGQPIDGLATQTDTGDGYWFGTGLHWSPKPSALMMNDQYGTPGTGGFPGNIDMGQAAQGAYDATWLSWLKADASQAAANGTPITVVRIWQEINGNWFPWSVNQTGHTSVDGTAPGAAWSASTVVAAWQHMAEQVRIALPNAKIEWNLNVGQGWGNSPGNGTGFDLYPGDKFVDVIGLDAYEKNASWADTVSGPGVNLNELVAFATAHNKLVGISETAAHNNDGGYMTSMTNFFDGLGARAAYISYYDQGTVNNGGDNIVYSPTGTDSAPAVRAALSASSVGTKPYTGSL